MRFFKSSFFRQTAAPGPTRDVLGPFLFLTIFHGDSPLSYEPGSRAFDKPKYSPGSQVPGSCDSAESYAPGSHGQYRV